MCLHCVFVCSKNMCIDKCVDSTITFVAQCKMTCKKTRCNYISLSNRDGVGALSYRMLDCPDQVVIAQVDDKGLLFSSSLTGISSLLITSQETVGVNQTLILAVKVSLRANAFKLFVFSK